MLYSFKFSFTLNIDDIIFFLSQWNSSETSQITLGFLLEFAIPVNSGQVVVDGVTTKKELFLGGKISHEIGTSKVTGSLYMRGLWRQAFGVKWLAFGNIHLG